MKRGVLLIALVMFFTQLTGQVASPGTDLLNYLEKNGLTGEFRDTYPDLGDEILSLLLHPVDINSNDEAELGRLFYLSIFQVRSILKYTSSKGAIISPYELAYLPGFDMELASVTASFIKVLTSPGSKINFYPSTRIMTNLEYTEPTDYTTLSEGTKVLLKISHEQGQVSAGLTVEKDRGEKLIAPGGLPDFTSGYIRYSGDKILKSLIIGDYRVRFGQGLSSWTGYSMGTSPMTENPMKGVSTIVPYSSTDENDFFRGVALSAKAAGISIHGFYSSNLIDASTATIGNKLFISGFPSDGIHYDRLSMSRRNAVMEQSYGANINITGKLFQVGSSLVTTQFPIPVVTDSTTTSMFDFSGNGLTTITADWSINLREFYLYGEYGFNPGGGSALIAGMRLSPGGSTRVNILYASTGNGFSSFHGKILGKKVFNRFTGYLLSNIWFEPFAHARVGTGLIISTDKWFTRFSEPPSRTIKWESIFNYSPVEKWSLNCAFNYKVYPEYITPPTGVKNVADKYSAGGRITIRYNPGLSVQISARFQMQYLLYSLEKGIFAYTSVKFSHPGKPYSIISRITLFKTDSWESRIYTWEDDLLYSPRISPYWGGGMAGYIIAEITPVEKLRIRIKYSQTSRKMFDYEPVNVKNDYRLQLLFSF